MGSGFFLRVGSWSGFFSGSYPDPVFSWELNPVFFLSVGSGFFFKVVSWSGFFFQGPIRIRFFSWVSDPDPVYLEGLIWTWFFLRVESGSGFFLRAWIRSISTRVRNHFEFRQDPSAPEPFQALANLYEEGEEIEKGLQVILFPPPSPISPRYLPHFPGSLRFPLMWCHTFINIQN